MGVEYSVKYYDSTDLTIVRTPIVKAGDTEVNYILSITKVGVTFQFRFYHRGFIQQAINDGVDDPFETLSTLQLNFEAFDDCLFGGNTSSFDQRYKEQLENRIAGGFWYFDQSIQAYRCSRVEGGELVFLQNECCSSQGGGSGGSSGPSLGGGGVNVGLWQLNTLYQFWSLGGTDIGGGGHGGGYSGGNNPNDDYNLADLVDNVFLMWQLASILEVVELSEEQVLWLIENQVIIDLIIDLINTSEDLINSSDLENVIENIVQGRSAKIIPSKIDWQISSEIQRLQHIHKWLRYIIIRQNCNSSLCCPSYDLKNDFFINVPGFQSTVLSGSISLVNGGNVNISIEWNRLYAPDTFIASYVGPDQVWDDRSKITFPKEGSNQASLGVLTFYIPDSNLQGFISDFDNNDCN